MNAAECAVPGCGRPVPDQAYACPRCASRFERNLGAVPGLLVEVETTRARLARIGAPGGAAAVQWHERASAAGAALAVAVVRLARHVGAERGQAPPVPPPAMFVAGRWGSAPPRRAEALAAGLSDGLSRAGAAAALWLRRSGAPEWLRHRPEGPAEMETVAAVVAGAEHAIDRQADRRYAGPCLAPVEDVSGCPCPCHAIDDACRRPGGCAGEHQPAACAGELYAKVGADFVECEVCGTQFDVRARRAWLLESAKDALAGAAQIASLLAEDGEDPARLAGRIRTWASRGRLAARAWSAWGRNDDEDTERLHPRYRVGDVEELLRQARAAEARGKVSA